MNAWPDLETGDDVLVVTRQVVEKVTPDTIYTDVDEYDADEVVAVIKLRADE